MTPELLKLIENLGFIQLLGLLAWVFYKETYPFALLIAEAIKGKLKANGNLPAVVEHLETNHYSHIQQELEKMNLILVNGFSNLEKTLERIERKME